MLFLNFFILVNVKPRGSRDRSSREDTFDGRRNNVAQLYIIVFDNYLRFPTKAFKNQINNTRTPGTLVFPFTNVSRTGCPEQTAN